MPSVQDVSLAVCEHGVPVVQLPGASSRWLHADGRKDWCSAEGAPLDWTEGLSRQLREILARRYRLKGEPEVIQHWEPVPNCLDHGQPMVRGLDEWKCACVLGGPGVAQMDPPTEVLEGAYYRCINCDRPIVQDVESLMHLGSGLSTCETGQTYAMVGERLAQ